MWYSTFLNTRVRLCTVEVHVLLPVFVAEITVAYSATLKLQTNVLYKIRLANEKMNIKFGNHPFEILIRNVMIHMNIIT